MRAVVVALVLAACGHPPEPRPIAAAGSATPVPIDARIADATPDAPTPDAAVAQQVQPPDDLVVAAPEVRSCPKTYAALTKATCAIPDASKLACKYPDGHCECVIAQPCSGWAGAYEEARKHPRAIWSCTPRVRDDGCPGEPPKVGSRCTTPGQSCMFGSCGGEVIACRSGTWVVDRVIGPPPAAPPHH